MLTQFIRLSILPVALIALAMPALADSDKGNSGKAPPASRVSSSLLLERPPVWQKSH